MTTGNSRNFELKLGKTGLVILIAGMSVLLCCVFLFGVGVGKNIDYYPEKIASLPQKLLALFWRPAKIKVAQSNAEKKSAQKETDNQEELDLTFFNTLTSKKGLSKEQHIPEKKPLGDMPAIQQSLPPVINEAKSAALKPEIETKGQQSAGENAASGDEIEAKIKEAESALNNAAGSFSVQVASLREKSKALQMHKKLLSLGYSSRIVENNVPKKGRWFRVVIDGFSTKIQARKALEKIADTTGSKGIVRRIDSAAPDN